MATTRHAMATRSASAKKPQHNLLKDLAKKNSENEGKDVLGTGCACGMITRCLTDQCTCFNKGIICTSLCKCVGCGNTRKDNEPAPEPEPEPGESCGCRKGCKTGHCKCLQAESACGFLCYCSDCANPLGAHKREPL